MSFRPRTLFVVVMALALGWAAFTRHVWEDYYITYRASRNLATGQGLTFTAGERVHSFTSPLGVLLPAAASLATANRSDDVALWIFRVLASAALAGAVAFTAAIASRGPGGGRGTALFAAAFVALDAKILDYTINGMETPFLLLFTAWGIWAFATQPGRTWVHLGLAWAGMMWTRPDAFIYIGALGIGALLFQPRDGSGPARVGRLRLMVAAGLLTTVVYLPWLLWAWRYYGSPLPHTIVAKGLFNPKVTPALLWEWVVNFPGGVWRDPSILAGTFMPAYGRDTGWPAFASQLSAVLAAVGMLLWAVPRLRWEARIASFGALAGQFYLRSFVGFPVPWYLPAISFLTILALVLAWGQAAAAVNRPAWRVGFRVGAVALMASIVALSGAVAVQLRWQQRIVETGQRRVIGEWLKAQAKSPRESVFLEPLGYIGFFSGLKMLDYPGLGSPEVVAARGRAESHSYPWCWSEIIMDLQPEWLVLREGERKSINDRDPEVLAAFYDLARVFDVRPAVAAVRFLPGRAYLQNDAYFEVYRRKASLPADRSIRRIELAEFDRRDAWDRPAHHYGAHIMAHAPSRLGFNLPARAKGFAGGFGFLEGAYAAKPPDATDGATFHVVLVTPTGERRVLFERHLEPAAAAADRGTQPFRVELPPDASGRLELEIDPGRLGSNAYDQTYWTALRIETPRLH